MTISVKLFGNFEAIMFSEENMIFITSNGYLYYIYDIEYKHWRKHKNAGNDHLTVQNYPDVSVEELTAALCGSFPKKETDFMRVCSPSELCIRDMMDLMLEDYPRYMSDWDIRNTIHHFLLKSDITFKSYLKLKELLDNALSARVKNEQVLLRIRELSYEVIGRDIFKIEISIDDGHNGSSYFWIQPVRVIDYENTDSLVNVAEMSSAEISIEEDDVAQYLTPFLYKHFDNDLKANKTRWGDVWEDPNGNVHKTAVDGFEWYLTHNFYTFEAVRKILVDIKHTIDALISGIDTEFTQKLKIKRGTETYELLYAKGLTEEQIKAYNDNRPKEDDTEAEMVIDFYQRFLYRMEYMLKVGEEKGYDLISVMGP